MTGELSDQVYRQVLFCLETPCVNHPDLNKSSTLKINIFLSCRDLPPTYYSLPKEKNATKRARHRKLHPSCRRQASEDQRYRDEKSGPLTNTEPPQRHRTPGSHSTLSPICGRKGQYRSKLALTARTAETRPSNQMQLSSLRPPSGFSLPR